jgi:hypothetical protein
MTGSPFVTSKQSAGIAALSENALELIRWQPLQWQAMVSSGRFVTLRRTRPQRQPPSFTTSSIAAFLPLAFAIPGGMTNPL